MELYISLKKQLKLENWLIIGGQPPSGTDHLPVIEIKQDHDKNSGSKNSFKPDLVAFKENQLRVFEIKPTFSESDELKLLSFLQDEKRIASFWAELDSRRITQVIDARDNFSTIQIQGALVFRGISRPSDFLWVHVETPDGYKELKPLSFSG